MSAPDRYIPAVELDIATVVARIQQLDALGAEQKLGVHGWLWDRVMTCDVPRLRGHLGADTLELLESL